MFPVLRPLLNRGGAGFSISREETAALLLPYVERAQELLKVYAAALPRLRDRDGAARVEAMLPYLRTDLSKLYESVYSAGGRTPSRMDAPAPAADFGASDAGVLRVLLDRERAFGEGVAAEVDAVHHQERTRAVLKAVAAGSDARTDLLRELAGRRP